MSAFRTWAMIKALVVASFVLQTSLSGCGSVDGSPRKPTSCPFGHTELAHVPILYGLLVGGEDLRKKFDRLEVWPGGCVSGDEKEKIVCKTCRYYFEPHFQYWSKHAADPKLLQSKPDPFVADWPNGKHETNGHFYQHVRDQSVCGEEFNGWYELSEKETESLVLKHLARFAFKFERQDRDFGARHYVDFRAFQNSHYYFVEIMNDSGHKDVHVRAVRSVEPPYGY